MAGNEEFQVVDKEECKARGCLICFFLPFMLFGLGSLFLIGQVTALQCRYISPYQLECVKETKWLGLIPMGKETFDDVQGAQVDRSRGRKGGSTYNVKLTRRQGGVVPLRAVRSSGAEPKEKVAAQINAYVKDGGMETLELRLGPEWFGMVMATIFFLIGGVPIILSIVALIPRKVSLTTITSAKSRAGERKMK